MMVDVRPDTGYTHSFHTNTHTDTHTHTHSLYDYTTGKTENHHTDCVIGNLEEIQHNLVSPHIFQQTLFMLAWLFHLPSQVLQAETSQARQDLQQRPVKGIMICNRDVKCIMICNRDQSSASGSATEISQVCQDLQQRLVKCVRICNRDWSSVPQSATETGQTHHDLQQGAAQVWSFKESHLVIWYLTPIQPWRSH